MTTRDQARTMILVVAAARVLGILAVDLASAYVAMLAFGAAHSWWPTVVPPLGYLAIVAMMVVLYLIVTAIRYADRRMGTTG